MRPSYCSCCCPAAACCGGVEDGALGGGMFRCAVAVAGVLASDCLVLGEVGEQHAAVAEGAVGCHFVAQQAGAGGFASGVDAVGDEGAGEIALHAVAVGFSLLLGSGSWGQQAGAVVCWLPVAWGTVEGAAVADVGGAVDWNAEHYRSCCLPSPGLLALFPVCFFCFRPPPCCC